MSAQPLAIVSTGTVTAVGLNAPASCAAIRAKVTNPLETRFVDAAGDWITGCSVLLERPWRGGRKLAAMAATAISECLAAVPTADWPSIPLWLCVAEKSRPGRAEGLDDQLFLDIGSELDTRFAEQSAIVAQGRVSIATALYQARQLIYEHNVPHVLVAATDSLLSWPTLSAYEKEGRLLSKLNSNGFIPGEAAAAVLVSRPSGQPELACTGIGFGTEEATIHSEQPLRADGLVQAIQSALAEAGCGLHDLDFRISDLSGEQYYFKEAALALGRVLRQRKEEFELWHAAECTGETGAAAGLVALAVANAACRKAYAPGAGILFHASNDSGERAAAVLGYGVH
jgi:3-oxoacyl-[acyl-carrier-protein] synthase-1